MEVFVSHINPEAPLASVLKKWIEDAFVGKVRVFVSSEDDSIPPGQEWFREIADSLSSTKVLLAICSKESVHRPWINFEAGAGWIRGIPVIPLCHSGMTVGGLPQPLSHLQALDDVEEDGFASKLMAALATHLGFPREPRIPYQEMTTEVQDALPRIEEQSGQPDQEEEMGFLDHLISMQERIGEIFSFLSAMGDDVAEFSIEASNFIDRANKAESSDPEEVSRSIWMVARDFGERLDTYVQKVESLNEKYEVALPEAERSLRYVIRFQDPQKEDDWKGVGDFMGFLESSEDIFSKSREAILSDRKVLIRIPNYQKHINRAATRMIEQYDILASNLDGTLEMFQKARAYLKSLER